MKSKKLFPEQSQMNIVKYAIYKFLFELCGESPEVLENAVIEEIAHCQFHITCDRYNPYDGIDLKMLVEIREDPNTTQHRYIAAYSVYDSVYGDDGTVYLDL